MNILSNIELNNRNNSNRYSIERIQNYKRKAIIDRPDLFPAAVLLPLFQKNGETHILLTKRTDMVEHHKGQISFPGGAFHYEDLDCLTTALRETEEEIGIAMDAVEVVGELDHMVTVSNFRICPYVGIIPYPYPFKLSPFEVDRLIELPFAHLINQTDITKEVSFIVEGHSDVNLTVKYQDDFIWGATARILKNFFDILCWD